MRVLASRTCDRAGDFANRLVVALRQIEHFAGRGIKGRRNRSAQGLVLCIPEFDCERSLMATEEWRRDDCRARVAFFELEPKPRDGQFIGMAEPFSSVAAKSRWSSVSNVLRVSREHISQPCRPTRPSRRAMRFPLPE